MPLVDLVAATAEQAPVLANLVELYVHDFSEFVDVRIGPDGRFGYPPLQSYWRDAHRFPYLIMADGELAGFALVQRGSQITGDPDVWDVAEFFVLRGWRRHRVGGMAAHMLWRRHGGRWEVRVRDGNPPAHRFWQRAVEDYLGASLAYTVAETPGKRWSVLAFDATRSAAVRSDLKIDVVAATDRARTDQVRKLMREYAALPHTEGRWLTAEQDIADLPHPFVFPSGALLLATAGGDAVGCGGIRALSADVGEIKRVYVRPAARGQGIGEALTTRLVSEARRLGFQTVRLDTAPELAAARALYRRMGFVEIPHYRDDLLADAVCYERAVTL